MKLNPSPKVRIALYLFTMLGAPVVSYLNAKGYIGEIEIALWSAEVAVIAFLAQFNVSEK